MIFWDTSALVKCYDALERDHNRARNLLLRETGHKGSMLLRPEAVSAIVRKLGANRRVRDSLLVRFDEHLKHFGLLPIDEQQIGLAVRLIRKHGLRAGDAIQLAAAALLARELGASRIRFATSDVPQARAGRAEGLRVIELGA